MLELVLQNRTVNLASGESHGDLTWEEHEGWGQLTNMGGATVLFKAARVDGRPNELEDTPMWRRVSSTVNGSASFHYIRSGEAIPIRVDLIPLPDPSHIDQVHSMLGRFMRLDLLDEQPSLAHLVDLFGDKGFSANVVGEGRDLGWLIRNAKARGWTTKPAINWQDRITVRDQGGIGSGEYDELVWIALKWLRHRRIEDWYFGYERAITHACIAIERTGKDWGMMRYPKGEAHVGEWVRSSESKQFLPGLLLWAWMTKGHPILDSACRLRIARLSSMSPTWYSHQYGARGWRFWARDLRFAFTLSNDQVLAAKGKAAVDHLLTKWDHERGCYVQTAGYISPWQQGPAAEEALSWSIIHGGYRREEIEDQARRIIEIGCYEGPGGLLLTKYRLASNSGPEEPAQHLNNTAFMLGIIEKVGTDEEIAAARRTVYEFDARGATMAQAAQGVFPDAEDIGIDQPQQGSGSVKSKKITLMGTMWR